VDGLGVKLWNLSKFRIFLIRNAIDWVHNLWTGHGAGPWWTHSGGNKEARQRRCAPEFPCAGPHCSGTGSKRRGQGALTRLARGGEGARMTG
jgi:hypothetical protein